LNRISQSPLITKTFSTSGKKFYLKFLAGSVFERIRAKEIGKLFYKDNEYIFNKIQPFINDHIYNILDIGCGLGGFDALLYNKLESTPQLFMMDKDDESPINGRHYTGFEKEPAAYNSLKATRDFLIKNNVLEEHISLIEAENGFPKQQEFDVVVSFLAWGFHFPVSYYINEVYRSLKNNGSLCIDLRKGTNGIDELKEYFKEVNLAYEGEKHLCVVATKRV
jgi:SAM-dependent methyltransferase